jgi:secondary thiamine-phosphate synthase enzyme
MRRVSAYGSAFETRTSGKGTYEITGEVVRAVRQSGVETGTVTVFIKHTSASLIVFENADPSARADLDDYFERLVPEDADGFTHTLEGPDDMTSHIRAALTATSLVIPIADGHLQLGTWQGIFVFEHREAPHRRQIALTVLGA